MLAWETPADFPNQTAIDVFYQIVFLPYPPQERVRHLTVYINDWGNNNDRAILLGYLNALAWAEDATEGDAKSAVLDREIIGALAAEVMARYWKKVLLCAITEREEEQSSNRYRTWEEPRPLLSGPSAAWE